MFGMVVGNFGANIKPWVMTKMMLQILRHSRHYLFICFLTLCSSSVTRWQIAMAIMMPLWRSRNVLCHSQYVRHIPLERSSVLPPQRRKFFAVTDAAGIARAALIL